MSTLAAFAAFFFMNWFKMFSLVLVLFFCHNHDVKGGFMSEDTEGFLSCQNEYSKSLSWAENLNKLFTILGGKFKFSAQDNDLEHSFWQCKNPPASLKLKVILERDILLFLDYL